METHEKLKKFTKYAVCTQFNRVIACSFFRNENEQNIFSRRPTKISFLKNTTWWYIAEKEEQTTE
jgi:hypothetical protein